MITKNLFLVTLLLCLLAPSNIVAKKKPFGKGLYWEFSSDGTLTISGNGDMPNFPKKRPWESLFKEGKVYKVVIENGVTSIGNGAFSGYVTDNLRDVIIPNSITRIGAGAFSGCNLIKSIKLNVGLKQIGSDAFWGCGFKDVVLPNTVTSIGEGCFAFSSVESVIMSDNISDIPKETFEDCVFLKHIKFPSKLKTIGDRAFSIVREEEHGVLESIDLPVGVESIGEQAFCGNAAKFLVIPQTVQNIGDKAFTYSSFLAKTVVEYNGEIRSLPDWINEYNAKKIGLDGNAVWSCKNSIYNSNGTIVVHAKRGRSIVKRVFSGTNTSYYEIEEGGVKGIVNNKGMWIVPIANGYTEAALIKGNYFKIKKESYYGIIDSDGKNIIPTSRGYTSISGYDAENRTFAFSKKGYTGICNEQGEELSLTKLSPTIEEIKANGEYADIIPINNDGKKYYIVKSKGWRYGLIDAEGNVIVPTEMNSLEEAGIGFLKFRVGSYWGIMNYHAKVIIPTDRGYTWIGNYVSTTKRFPYEMDDYKGECNNLGQQVSKIKVTKPKPSTTAVASSSSSSSSSATSNSSSSTTSSNNNSRNSSSGNNTTTIVVEHQHQPVPVQEWQACFACGGMGTMGCDFCGGGGTKYIGDRLHRCSRCNGRGIISCNVCFGNKGQYVTVYK